MTPITVHPGVRMAIGIILIVMAVVMALIGRMDPIPAIMFGLAGAGLLV